MRLGTKDARSRTRFALRRMRLGRPAVGRRRRKRSPRKRQVARYLGTVTAISGDTLTVKTDAGQMNQVEVPRPRN